MLMAEPLSLLESLSVRTCVSTAGAVNNQLAVAQASVLGRAEARVQRSRGGQHRACSSSVCRREEGSEGDESWGCSPVRLRAHRELGCGCHVTRPGCWAGRREKLLNGAQVPLDRKAQVPLDHEAMSLGGSEQPLS